MTIINAEHNLEQILAPAVLEHIARLCKFCLRQRGITPAMRVTALLRAMGGSKSMTLPVYTDISMSCHC